MLSTPATNAAEFVQQLQLRCFRCIGEVKSSFLIRPGATIVEPHKYRSKEKKENYPQRSLNHASDFQLKFFLKEKCQTEVSKHCKFHYFLHESSLTPQHLHLCLASTAAAVVVAPSAPPSTAVAAVIYFARLRDENKSNWKWKYKNTFLIEKFLPCHLSATSTATTTITASAIQFNATK